jgi:Ca2+-binding RTX toxin-like protein
MRGLRLAGVVAALFLLGLAYTLIHAPELEAVRPLCGGKRATIASNDRLIQGSRAPDVIVGGQGPNKIVGAGGNDLICGGFGRDAIFGGRGKDTLDGKKDADLVHGGRGSDEVDGGAGRDRVWGDSGNDVVRGGPGRGDGVDGGLGDDRVEGGRGGFDTVSGGIGRDRIEGGPGGHDVATYLSAGGPIEVDLVRGVVSGAEQEQLRGIEKIVPPADPGGGLTARVEMRRSPVGSSIAISGSDGPDNLFVGFSDGAYVVSGMAEPVRLGGGRVRSILASLGAGDDTIEIGRSVPPTVSVRMDGEAGSDRLRGGRGGDTLYGGDDHDPDRLEGAAGEDALFGVNILHPRRESGAAIMLGGPGDDLLIGGQPCEGDFFHGGGGDTDSASFARVRNAGTHVQAEIGGRVTDPEAGACAAGRISLSIEKIEGSTGPDDLSGRGGENTLLGRGGDDEIDGAGGDDRCIGGRGEDRDQRCEYVR